MSGCTCHCVCALRHKYSQTAGVLKLLVCLVGMAMASKPLHCGERETCHSADFNGLSVAPTAYALPYCAGRMEFFQQTYTVAILFAVVSYRAVVGHNSCRQLQSHMQGHMTACDIGLSWSAMLLCTGGVIVTHLDLSQLPLSLHVLEAASLGPQLGCDPIQLLLRSSKLLPAGLDAALQGLQLTALVSYLALQAVMLAAGPVQQALQLPYLTLLTVIHLTRVGFVSRVMQV